MVVVVVKRWLLLLWRPKNSRQLSLQKKAWMRMKERVRREREGVGVYEGSGS